MRLILNAFNAVWAVDMITRWNSYDLEKKPKILLNRFVFWIAKLGQEWFSLMNVSTDMVMDVRDMSAFDTRSFAAVIDKGSVFAIMCAISK